MYYVYGHKSLPVPLQISNILASARDPLNFIPGLLTKFQFYNIPK